MRELLTALVAASKVGFDAPGCAPCQGTALDWVSCSGDACLPVRGCLACPQCRHCSGTGLDASDPEKLIGRAESWLLARGLDIKVTWQALDVFTLVDPDGYHERHDGTPAGLATAILRLVARVGGAA